MDASEWPPRIQRMPRHRGLPRLYTAIEVDGVVDFATTDMARWMECIRTGRCGVCGFFIHSTRRFAIGGPESKGQKAFFDPPMHRECAEWSFDNCPYMTGRVSYQSAERVATKEERLTAAGGIKVASQDVADAETVYLCSGASVSGPHRTANGGWCWAFEGSMTVVRERSRRRAR